jgi:hypothetical protein
MRVGNSNEDLGPGSIKASADLTPADAWIDEDRNRAQLEERKCQCEKLTGRRHQERHPRPLSYTQLEKAAGKSIAFSVEISVRNTSGGEDIGRPPRGLFGPPF